MPGQNRLLQNAGSSNKDPVWSGPESSGFIGVPLYQQRNFGVWMPARVIFPNASYQCSVFLVYLSAFPLNWREGSYCISHLFFTT
jgi:hypothetical protein